MAIIAIVSLQKWLWLGHSWQTGHFEAPIPGTDFLSGVKGQRSLENSIFWKFREKSVQRKIRSEKNPFREKSIQRKILQENWLSENNPSVKNPSENGHSANHPTIVFVYCSWLILRPWRILPISFFMVPSSITFESRPEHGRSTSCSRRQSRCSSPDRCCRGSTSNCCRLKETRSDYGCYRSNDGAFLRSQTVLIKLVLPQAAQLGIHFLTSKTEMLHLLKGPV